jgi:hypothetical protein
LYFNSFCHPSILHNLDGFHIRWMAFSSVHDYWSFGEYNTVTLPATFMVSDIGY